MFNYREFITENLSNWTKILIAPKIICIFRKMTLGGPIMENEYDIIVNWFKTKTIFYKESNSIMEDPQTTQIDLYFSHINDLYKLKEELETIKIENAPYNCYTLYFYPGDTEYNSMEQHPISRPALLNFVINIDTSGKIRRRLGYGQNN